MHWSRVAVFCMQPTTAQLYPDRDTFEFDQAHVTKNQLITVLILLSESLAIYQNVLILQPELNTGIYPESSNPRSVLFMHTHE